LPVFEYKAINERGKEVKGILDAENSMAARGKLRTQGLHPTFLSETVEKKRAESKFRFSRTNPRDIALLMRQFSTLVGSGLPLLESLTALVEQTEQPGLKKILTRVRERVLEGKPLSAAMAEHPRLFSELQVNMVKAGERSGGLEVVLERLAELMERRLELVQRVRSALTYPVFMLIIGTGVLFFLLSFVVPKVTDIFKESGQILPLPTIVLIAIANFLKDAWWFILILAVGALFGLYRFLRTEKGKRMKDVLVLRLPLWGGLQAKLIVARLSRTLGTLLMSGVSLMPSLDICRAVTGNVVFEDAIDAMKDEVEAGKSLAAPLKNAGIFPPMAVHMVQSGEKSGRLEEMMFRVADTYEKEVENTVNAMTSLLEPVMILFMGLIVGFIVLAVLLPILEMSQVVK
jgi:general secretion pathway protein F